MTVNIKNSSTAKYNLTVNNIDDGMAYLCGNGYIYIGNKLSAYGIIAFSICGNKVLYSTDEVSLQAITLNVEVA